MYLRIHVLYNNEWHTARLIDADHIDQRITFNMGGVDLTAPFHHVQNVALVEDTGEVIENYGAPKNMPAMVNNFAPCPICASRHQDAPLFESPRYFEHDYCAECMQIHMVEKTRQNRTICHGVGYFMDTQANQTHFSRKLGKGFELVAYSRPQPLPIDWQMALDAAREPEYIDIDQDW